MANIVLKTFAAGDEGQGTVTPQDDSLIYQNAVSVNGIFGGATVTLTGANTLHVASGFGIICGRFFEINESDISVQLSSSGTLSGRLKIHLDLNNADNPIEIVTETGATLPSLSGDSNININGGAFDMELCTFSVNELTISSLVNTFPTIDNTSKQVRRKTAYAVNDFALCQNASDSLIFVCTTAGTTAIQEPTAYQTVTDGNTVTDGTAVFKAVSVSGQITQISKIGNLSNLNTTDKSSAVAAINEVSDAVGDVAEDVGDLSNLDTTVKTSAVEAINEVNTKVSKTEDLISIVENGNTCTHTGGIAQGQYVNWKGNLYTADSNISVGATFASSGGSKNLTAVVDGGLNDVNHIFNSEIPEMISNERGVAYKFPSGLMICTKTATDSVNFNQPWGSGYIGVLDLGDWPVSFIETPKMSCTPISAYSGIIANFDILPSNTSCGDVILARLDSTGTRTVSISVIAIGRWK